MFRIINRLSKTNTKETRTTRKESTKLNIAVAEGEEEEALMAEREEVAEEEAAIEMTMTSQEKTTVAEVVIVGAKVDIRTTMKPLEKRQVTEAEVHLEGVEVDLNTDLRLHSQ